MIDGTLTPNNNRVSCMSDKKQNYNIEIEITRKKFLKQGIFTLTQQVDALSMVHCGIATCLYSDLQCKESFVILQSIGIRKNCFCVTLMHFK